MKWGSNIPSPQKCTAIRAAAKVLNEHGLAVRFNLSVGTIRKVLSGEYERTPVDRSYAKKPATLQAEIAELKAQLEAKLTKAAEPTRSASQIMAERAAKG
jgi:hypothetical protein